MLLVLKRTISMRRFCGAPKQHMLWVLKRTVSMRRFFGAPKTYVKTDGKNILTILRSKFSLTKPMWLGAQCFTNTISILNKSENATLQLSIFYEKVLDKKYLLKLHNVAQTSSRRFIEISPICLV